MIPTDKSDIKSFDTLSAASDEDVLSNADQLLEWLQDRNWPVFGGVVLRLSTLGSDLQIPVAKVLAGNDSIWKANIIGYLIPSFDHADQLRYSVLLENLLDQNDESDLVEGVIDLIEIQLSNVRSRT